MKYATIAQVLNGCTSGTPTSVECGVKPQVSSKSIKQVSPPVGNQNPTVISCSCNNNYLCNTIIFNT